MATAIYWPWDSKQARMMLETNAQKRIIQKRKHSQRRKVRQRLQQTQQSNTRWQSRQSSMRNKRNSTRQIITLLENGYPVLIRKENKMNRAVKFHQSVNKCKQRRYCRNMTIHAAIMIKRRASQWMEMECDVIKKKSTISKSQSWRKRIYIMRS